MHAQGIKKMIAMLCFCAIFCATSVYSKTFDTNVTEINTIINLYQWFNEIAGDKKALLSQTSVSQYFTDTAKMITNDKLVCQGVFEHYQHFVELNRHFKMLNVNIDKMELRKSQDRVYLDYVLDGIDAKDKTVKIRIMGYMVVKNGKIDLFKEVMAHLD